ncbi:MAG: Hsp70 family protein [Gemmataceae bacterium]
MARYLIGIDLGTTNSALAYIDLKGPGIRSGTPEIRTFAIPQLVAPAETAPRSLLPSFLYLPGEHDLPAGSAALPWDRERSFIVGEFARQHGARVPGRLATSAKSWLCHAGVDRTAPLLPWSAPADVPRVSPVETTARYLRHLIEAWNHAHREDPEAGLEKQPVVLTVPASFDDVARNLTVDAARQAGIANLTLLEEPQAAFYCWLAGDDAKKAREAIKPGMRCLVIDVGGGTSDFSLIQGVEQHGELGFVRQAVGDHLLLGGDNMDLALAKFVEGKLPAAGKLDAAQYGMLAQACRHAKETLLAPRPADNFTVTVMGRGRKVVGAALHAEITPAEVRSVLFDGFFPDVPLGDDPQRGARVGLHEMGLPYVSDPAITRHLASFLRRHPGEGVTAAKQAAPDAILFNGGVFQPVPLREHLIAVMHHWFDTPEQAWQPLLLTNPSLDLAVAEGAAYYAYLRHSGGKRIGGGIARSYYVAVSGEQKSESGKLLVLCVVPRRLEEGEEVVLEKPELKLALGQPVLFPLYTSTVRGDDKPGDLLELAPEQLLQLPPLHTVLRGGKRSGTRSIPVTLAARCTEIGTLELWCAARDGNNRWRLEFNVRDIVGEVRADPEAPVSEDDEEGGEAPAVQEILPEEQVQQAAARLRACFGAGSDSAIEPRELTKALEKVFEASRHQWPTALCRRLWDFLSEVFEQRRKSPQHLGRWYNLVGFCLRPGFGDPLDRFRVEQLWKLLQAPARTEGAKASKSSLPEGGADYWIMWRRVAGGLNTSYQNTLFNRLRSVLVPSRGKQIAKPHANELAEMWRAAAALERLELKSKEALGDALLKQVRKPPAPTYAFWSLTRLGTRVLLYGPLNSVVHREVVERWLDALASFEPAHESDRSAWCFCLAQLARKSGQRALDVDDAHQTKVAKVLQDQNASPELIRMVEEVVEPESEEQSRMFGEALPIGLRVVKSGE